jgi:hypothetical protein
VACVASLCDFVPLSCGTAQWCSSQTKRSPMPQWYTQTRFCICQQDEPKHWLFAVILTLGFSDLGFRVGFLEFRVCRVLSLLCLKNQQKWPHTRIQDHGRWSGKSPTCV